MYNHSDIERKWQDLKNNCDFYFSRIINYPLCPPEHVYISLTSRCNLRCKMCNVPSVPGCEKDELTTAEYKNVINQIAGMNIGHLIFSGGEPLLRADIFELIRHAVSKEIKMVDLITNGLLIDKRVAQELVDIHVSHITVSIDGMEETNDFIRGRGAFQKAISAIHLINKYKNDDFPTLGINFTIMDCNIDHILPMIDLAKRENCNILVFQPMLPDNTDMQQRKNDELWVSQENIPKLREAIARVLALKKDMQHPVIHVNDKILEMIPAYFLGLPLDRNLKCYEGIVRIVISPNGDLWTCRGTYGNVKKESLKDCWFSQAARKIRQSVKQCRNHCLQSCIFLAELSDTYSDIIRFKQLTDNQEKNKEYFNNLMALLKKYKSCLDNRKNYNIACPR